ncbi:NAD(P)H-hydrate dehydratase [Aeromonas salmonicida]|uniref:Bifunctional NAD(P)H-hydrate repair enzyme n=1 Tax=Aeromonas salmonicida TaxID=645 RepID=A0AAX3VXW2_AERSA|nr:NAD(P)H-hydrate dehydratase [Aeromonas salmonicida]RSM34274.1 bifunctional ADP-dependent NAD(P)H-hydrate dehydratase/NAD(P)H-hydrate epimerase [Aeromonas salmonicida]WHF38686.1 NAD(P)H-hydrate dehydratase [Aeromonas salmonicida]
MVKVIGDAISGKEVRSLPQSLWRTEQIRALEQRWAEREGQERYALMERAGAALRTYATHHWPRSCRWWIFVGPGNNGGDGYVLARLARQIGLEPRVIAARAPDELKGDARRAADDWLALGGTVLMAGASELDSLPPPDLVIDALLGTGVHTPLSPLLTKIVATINSLGAPVLAVDLPSGLNADTGCAMGALVRATRTLTFIGIKQGMLTSDGVDGVGQLDCDPLGVMPEETLQAAAERIDYPGLKHLLTPRQRSAHKGSHGKVLLAGGNVGMQGAIVLASLACLRAGAGLVRVCQHPSHGPVSLYQAELMNSVVDTDEYWASVRLVGPGLGQDEWGRRHFELLVNDRLPLVLDADGLNWLALCPRHQDNWVLTPHPGEAARLLGCSIADIAADRFAAVRRLQQRFGGVVLLKGAGSLIDDGKQITLCDEGNPGMASGGMGDLLSGIIAALLAQGWSAVEATRLGAVIHGEAADLAAADGERGMLASDLLPFIRRLVNPDSITS